MVYNKGAHDDSDRTSRFTRKLHMVPSGHGYSYPSRTSPFPITGVLDGIFFFKI